MVRIEILESYLFFNNECVLFLQSMVHPNPSSRPSAMAITHHPALCPQAQKSRAQLRKELNEERLKNEVLSR